MPWRRTVRRASGMLVGLGLLAVVSGLALYAVASWRGFDVLAERSVPFTIAGLFVGVLGSMGLLISMDRLPPGGGPGL